MYRQSILSMSHGNIAGTPNNPKGRVTNWYNADGVEKAVFSQDMGVKVSKSEPRLTDLAFSQCMALGMRRI